MTTDTLRFDLFKIYAIALHQRPTIYTIIFTMISSSLLHSSKPSHPGDVSNRVDFYGWVFPNRIFENMVTTSVRKALQEFVFNFHFSTFRHPVGDVQCRQHLDNREIVDMEIGELSTDWNDVNDEMWRRYDGPLVRRFDWTTRVRVGAIRGAVDTARGGENSFGFSVFPKWRKFLCLFCVVVRSELLTWMRPRYLFWLVFFLLSATVPVVSDTITQWLIQSWRSTFSNV